MGTEMAVAKRKRSQTTGLETLNWRHNLPLAHQQRSPRKVHWASKQTDPSIRFTAEISCTDATFVDTTIHKGQRCSNESVLDRRTHSAALFHGWRVAGSRWLVVGSGWLVAGCKQTLQLNTQRDLRSVNVSPSVWYENLNPVRVMDQPEAGLALRNHLIMQEEFAGYCAVQ